MSTNNQKTSIMENSEQLKPTKKILEIFEILSKEDAFNLIVLSKDGLKSTMETPENVGLTKKQYYTRLKQLVDLGIIEKNDSVYEHTTLGKLLYQNHLMTLLQHTNNSKNLEMVDLLKKSNKFNDEEITKFLQSVGIRDPIQSIDTKSLYTSNFEDMVSKVLEIIEFAKHDILLCTRFANDLIINSVLKKSNMGISVKVLADNSLTESYVKNESDSISNKDKNSNERKNVIVNPYYPSKIERRYVNVPYSMLIVDSSHVGIELVDSYDDSKFKGVIFVTSKSLGVQLKQDFDSLWQKSSDMPPQVIINNNR